MNAWACHLGNSKSICVGSGLCITDNMSLSTMLMHIAIYRFMHTNDYGCSQFISLCNIEINDENRKMNNSAPLTLAVKFD